MCCVGILMPTLPKTHTQLLKERLRSSTTGKLIERPNCSQRGYTHKWHLYRNHYLTQHPLCRICQAEGRVTAANVVDHIIPHKGDMRLFWEPTNHQPLCTFHHNQKTAKEDGGFGR